MTIEQNLIPSELLNGSSKEKFQASCYDLARIYTGLIDVDFDKDILPKLSDPHWWQADYGQGLREGKTLGMSTFDALRCLVDTHRTYQLYRGIEETVKELKRDGKENLISIDAGTGTGILAISLIALGVDKVYALEINKDTKAITEKFISKLELSDRITIIQCDATRVDITELKDRKADILVSENLSNGLMDEHQYDIINHLSNFLSADAQVLPYSADLFISMAQADFEGTDPNKKNANVKRVKWYKEVSPRVRYSTVFSKVGMEVPVIRSKVQVPVERVTEFNSFLIATRFTINSLGEPIILEPNSANFLGGSSVFRIEGGFSSGNENIDVDICYEVGRAKSELNYRANGNRLDISDPFLDK